MNSIIWKGVSSTEIKGLLISELPPISKPEMRVMETVVDGIHGSIIEELGYNPYDKPLVIGLRGDFNIDEVIKYFTGEGEVVFSNEPDKMYRAKINAQIDYTRLLRFRQATVIFRTQPFKYAFNEGVILTQITPDVEFIEVENKGLETSKPTLTITGSGTIEISVNGVGVFSYTFPEGENQVVIDSEKEDAHLDSMLKNRNMVGEFPAFQSGLNRIEWTGNVESIEIQPKSRWL